MPKCLVRLRNWNWNHIYIFIKNFKVTSVYTSIEEDET